MLGVGCKHHYGCAQAHSSARCASKLGPLAVLLEVATTLRSVLLRFGVCYTCIHRGLHSRVRAGHLNPKVVGGARRARGGACATVTERVGLPCRGWEGQHKVPTINTVLRSPFVCRLRVCLIAV